jgi:DNA-binding MarR family transcriptional regulator
MINQALFHKKVIASLLALDLTPGQPKILDYLQKHDGSIQKDIAYGCSIDPATLTGILRRMEEKDLVERRMLNGNRRSSYVYLTANGIENAKKISQIFHQAEKEVFNGISQEERDNFMYIFYKFCSNMSDT